MARGRSGLSLSDIPRWRKLDASTDTLMWSAPIGAVGIVNDKCALTGAPNAWSGGGTVPHRCKLMRRSSAVFSPVPFPPSGAVRKGLEVLAVLSMKIARPPKNRKEIARNLSDVFNLPLGFITQAPR